MAERTSRSVRGPALLPLTALLLAACAGAEPDAPAAAVRDSAGVSIVESPAEDRPLDWTFTPAYTVGDAEEGPAMLGAGFLGLSARTVSADSAGRLHVLDGHRVVVFGPDGAYEREVGREGEGPGELRQPGSATVTPGGEVWVFDFAQGGFARWGPEGEPLETVPMRVFPYPAVTRHAAFGGDVRVTAEAVFGERAGWTIRHYRGSDTTELAGWLSGPVETVVFEQCGIRLRVPGYFAPDPVWDRRGGAVAVASPDAYAVDVYRDGRRVRSVRRMLPVREADEAMARRAVGEAFRLGRGSGDPCEISPAEAVEKRGFEPVVPWIGGVSLAPDGTLWVQRVAIGPDDPRPVDVFDPDGAYLGTLPEGAALPVTWVGERAAVVETDALDRQTVVVGSWQR